MSEYDPTDFEGNERRQQDDKKALKLARDIEKADIKWLMKVRQGRRIVHRLLDRAGVFRSSFSTNALQMAYAEGLRKQGLDLLQMLNAYCPEQFSEMMKEANDKRNPDDASG